MCAKIATFISFGLMILVLGWQVRVASIHQSNSRTNQASHYHAPSVTEPEDPNAVIARYTELLAWFTGILAVVSIFQGFFLYRADKTARIMAETAQQQTAKMGEWANAAEKQTLIIAQQTDIQSKQHAVGRLQFFATHRPEIIVHAVEFLRVPGADEYDLIGASLLCFNKGPTLADDVVVRGEILPTANLAVDVQRKTVKVVAGLASGQKLRFEIKSEWQVRELAIRSRQGGHPPFFCVGTISYFDENKIVLDDQPRARRETGFCFKLTMDSHGEHWVSAKSPEHEYAY